MHLNYGDSEESTNEIIALDDNENETKSSDKYDSDSEDANSSSNPMPTPLLINKPKPDQFSQSTLISNKQQQQQQLNSIQSSSSSNGPSHMCKDCFRTFKDINNYKEHRFQEHQITDYPNIRKCSMCSYATLLKSKYDCHMRCHLNNKVIKCHRCDYSTINIRHMSRHERMHMISMNQAREPNKLNELHAISLKKSKDSLLAKSYLKKAKLKTAFKLLNNNQQHGLSKDLMSSMKKSSAYPHESAQNSSARPQLSGNEDKPKANMHQLNMLAMAAASSSHQKTVETREAEHKSINFEMIRSMILSQLEKKPNLSDEELIKSQLIALNSMKNGGVKLESDEQPSSDNYQLKFNNSFNNNLSSRSSNLITPPSSTSSASNSLASSPTGRKQSETPQHHQIMLPSYQICSPSTQDRYTPTQPAVNGQTQQDHMLMYQSNIENMLKMQSMPHVGPSPLIYSLLTNEMASSNAYNSNNAYQKSFQMSPSQMYHHQPVQHHKSLVSSSGQCGQNGPCKHKYELDKLRKNVLKLVYNLMPQLVSLFNLDTESVENNSNIDKLVDYLINYHNHNQASMNNGNLSYN